MKIALGVATNELLIFSEGDITLDDTGSLQSCCHVGLNGMFWILLTCSTMPNTKIRLDETSLGLCTFLCRKEDQS